jgi:Ca-activated chloride channel family protein
VRVADVDVAYHDPASGAATHQRGQLAVEVVADPARASALDAEVSGRLERSETAAVLNEANTLFERGLVDQARQRLAARQEALRAVAVEAKRAAPDKVARKVDSDFDRQLAAVGDANQALAQPEFATPPPLGARPAAAPAAPPVASRAGKSARKQNASRALEMGF